MAGLETGGLARGGVISGEVATGWLIMLVLVFSGWLAWIALPWTSGFVARIYASLPPAPPASAHGAEPKSGLAQLLSRLIQNPPDPQAVAYAAVFVVAFVVLSILLRGALKRLERPNST